MWSPSKGEGTAKVWLEMQVKAWRSLEVYSVQVNTLITALGKDVNMSGRRRDTQAGGRERARQGNDTICA